MLHQLQDITELLRGIDLNLGNAAAVEQAEEGLLISELSPVAADDPSRPFIQGIFIPNLTSATEAHATDHKDHMNTDSKPLPQPEATESSQAQAELFPKEYRADFIQPMLDGLASRFPYMFTTANIGLGMQAGWYRVFEELCVAIDELLGENKRGLHWKQTKEKFGFARWYWEIDGESDHFLDVANAPGTSFRNAPDPEEELRYAITLKVTNATARTFHMCMACGAEATRSAVKGYLVVLCQPHLQMYVDDPEACARVIYAKPEGEHG